MRSQCVVIVLDSVGIGAAPDAADYGDTGSDTLGHIAQSQGGLRLPNLQRLGLGNIRAHDPLLGCPPVDAPEAAFGRMQETALGKDTASGHWEYMGLVIEQAFRVFPDGFPPALIEKFLAVTGAERVLGGMPASGTQILEELGAEHMASGAPIVYTSADPVFQIAAHEAVVPLERLYAWCEAFFPFAIEAGLSRVIARPFVGDPKAGFTRTGNRHDWAYPPPRPTILDELQEHGVKTLGVGKISSIFSGQGVAGSVHTSNNAQGIDATIAAMRARDYDFVFTNLVDFDSEFGHRRDPAGYHRCLQEFDTRLPEILAALGPDDLLMITADHGNDPTWRGTDHTRELVPILAVGDGLAGRALGVRPTFADLGQSVAAFLGVSVQNPLGSSFV